VSSPPAVNSLECDFNETKMDHIISKLIEIFIIYEANMLPEKISQKSKY
jgi:hypothetical protein